MTIASPNIAHLVCLVRLLDDMHLKQDAQRSSEILRDPQSSEFES